MDSWKSVRVTHRDADRTDLLAEPVRPDHEDIPGLRTATLQVVRGRVAARHDVIEIAAQPEGLQQAEVVEPRRGRVVGGEEDVPSRAAESVERVLRVRHQLRAAVEHAVHVEDRDGHRESVPGCYGTPR